MSEITKQLQAEKLVNRHIIEPVNLTIEHLLEEQPDLLYEASNYKEIKEELNRDNEEGDEIEPEIYEFWSVSDWLYDKLKIEGEIVFECLDFFVWGRRTTGQAIKLDDVIQKIAAENGF